MRATCLKLFTSVSVLCRAENGDAACYCCSHSCRDYVWALTQKDNILETKRWHLHFSLLSQFL